jgi:serine/threonine protein kinase
VAVKVGGHERIVKEQKLMARLRHPHVVRTLGHSKRRRSSPDNMDSVCYAGIYEYCQQKDLMTFLATGTARSDVGKMTQIFDDILAGLEYIHDNHEARQTRGPIVHGDVKPENIMIDAEGRAKLGDFGLAQYQSPNMDVQGTPSYIAPEVVLDFLAGSAHPKFTTKADIFSFGVLMVVALTGHYPFKRLTAKLHSGQMTVAQVIKHFTPSRRTLKAINDISPRFKRMVDSCLCRYPEMRPSAAQLRALLYRRSKSTGEEGALLVPRTTTSASEPATQPQAPSTSLENNIPGPNRVAQAHTSKVPPSLAHIVHGMSTPLIPIPVSSGKFASDSFDN